MKYFTKDEKWFNDKKEVGTVLCTDIFGENPETVIGYGVEKEGAYKGFNFIETDLKTTMYAVK